MADDYKANTKTTGTVAVGGSVTGVIEKARDVDWFAVELVADETYRIDLMGRFSDNGTLWDPVLLGIYDADGNLIAGTADDDSGTGRDARIVFTATETGTHYIAAKGYLKKATGTYTVRVMPEDADSVVAGAIDLGDLVALDGARLHQDSLDGGADGADYYRFTLSETRKVKFKLQRQDADADLFLEDGDGNVLHSSTRDGTRREKIAATLEAGTYYVRVAAQETGDNAYTLRAKAQDPEPPNVAKPAGTDFPADTSTTGRVAVDGSIRGCIETSDDVDWFAVTLEKGKTYRFDLKGWGSGDNTLSNPWLRGIHDADGNLIPGTTNNNSDRTLHSRVHFTPKEGDTYYVAAGNDPSRHAAIDPNGCIDGGTYTLSVTEVDADDYAADTSTAGRVAVGGSATGTIDYVTDRDWFAVTLEKGKTYRFDLKGARSGDGTLRDPWLSGIHDADGNRIAGTADDGDDYSPYSEVHFTPTETATYYVEATTFGNTIGYGSTTGTYTLAVTDSTDDFTADTGTTGRAAVDGSVRGYIETPDDIDWFSVTLEAGKTYRFDLRGWRSGDNTLSNPWLRGIHDADGNRIPGTADNDSGRNLNSRVLFTPTEDATYYVAAGFDPSRHAAIDPNRGTGRGTYTLSVTKVDADDYAADTSTTGRVAVGGSATGTIDYVADRDWFAVTLEKGKSYRFDLKGSHTLDGTLPDPHLLGIHDADGNRIAGTTDNNSGTGWNSRVSFTPAESGTYYVAAGGSPIHYTGIGTYTLSVEEVVDAM